MSYENPRLDFFKNPIDNMVSFSEGNPGAATVLLQLMNRGAHIDPDDAFAASGLGCMGSLDNLDCYGSKIWAFFKDVAGEDLVVMVGLMRANQLGYISTDELTSFINGVAVIPRDYRDKLMAKVKERLPAFGGQSNV